MLKFDTVRTLLNKIVWPVEVQVRHNYKGLWVTRGRYKYKGLVPGLAKTLKQRLADENPVDVFKPVYIGLSPEKYGQRSSRLDKIKELKSLQANIDVRKKSKTHTLLIPLEDVQSDWLNENGPAELSRVIHHYGIYKDLFDERSYFLPLIPLKAYFDYDDKTVSVVHYGNVIKPREAQSPPTICYEAANNSWWSIMLINLDGHLTEQNKEYLHLLIGNIPGNDVEKGEIICPYLPPIPAKGTGYHRYVFILYLQNKKIDLSQYKVLKQGNLQERTFCNADFYSQYEDELTPAGLSFFQSNYDSSVQDTFYKVLDMEEPRYQYDFPQPYFKPQERIPENRSFNNYLDMHTDNKKIKERVLLKNLKRFHPFEGYEKPLQFPLAHRELWWEGKPNWLRLEKSRELTKIQKYKDDD